ncbi:MAG TPA: hypothetical protein VM286_03735 [Candidatus Thermoplasmatota archaeon]|nr:hypothetical protein [Candidatus Thermoplasmatota archaeon]
MGLLGDLMKAARHSYQEAAALGRLRADIERQTQMDGPLRSPNRLPARPRASVALPSSSDGNFPGLRGALTLLATATRENVDGQGFTAPFVPHAAHLLQDPDWTHVQAWTAWYIAGYHLPQLRGKGTIEGPPGPRPLAPSFVKQAYLQWWGGSGEAFDDLAHSRASELTLEQPRNSFLLPCQESRCGATSSAFVGDRLAPFVEILLVEEKNEIPTCGRSEHGACAHRSALRNALVDVLEGPLPICSRCLARRAAEAFSNRGQRHGIQARGPPKVAPRDE